MTLKTSVYIATSLDGYIARESGELDWLMVATSSSDDHGYAAYMATIDTLVMGRNTFEKVLTFGEWPYPHKRVVVLSSTLGAADVPAELGKGVEVHPGPLADLVEYLGDTGAKSLYLDGGQVIQSFLREGRLDELTITRIPVLLGSGIPLFGALAKDVTLQHMRSTTFESGFVQSTYRVLK
ncbi:dihydrofolate reductase family protein [Pseudomonas sp. SBB6]|uniref:dihydrofolate reductase family protein n=1 Tax=Pseudomonas sp. SBB6 TaxID=2962032 RepID=UPI0020B796C5|nr:dihydrofolate reductase family protein [Pseudomonas sp. SBB6]MCP3752274.1 dihydrofolate reductase family protein [Pseudomonas sp. SBB6]